MHTQSLLSPSLRFGGLGGGGSTSTPIIVIIALVVCVALAVIAYKVVKKYFNKQKLVKKSKILDDKVAVRHDEMVLKINLIILENEDLLQKFKHGQTELKMSQINKKAHKFLEEIFATKIYRIFFSQNYHYKEFNYHFKELRETKSNLWDKKITDTLDFFRTGAAILEEKEQYGEYLERAKNDVKEYYAN